MHGASLGVPCGKFYFRMLSIIPLNSLVCPLFRSHMSPVYVFF